MEKLTERANFIEHYSKLIQSCECDSINTGKAELLALYKLCGLSCSVDRITTELDLLRAVHAFEMYVKTTRGERDEMNELRAATRQRLDF